MQTRWEHNFGNDVTLTSSLLGVRQELMFNLGSIINFNLDLYRMGWREDFKWFASPEFELEWGMDVEYVFGETDIRAPFPPKEGEGNNSPISSQEVFLSQSNTVFGDRAFYLEGNYRPWKPLEITTGARMDWFGGEYKRIVGAPRGSIRYTMVPGTTLKGGAGLYYRRPDFDELDTEFGTPDLEPEESIQTYLGLEQEIVDGLTIDVQGFYKNLQNFVSSIPQSFDKDEEDDSIIGGPLYDNAGEGRVYGGELLLRQQFGRWFWGWIAYTLSRSERRDRPGEDFRLFDFDQTQ